jgi:hypothetical protein
MGRCYTDERLVRTITNIKDDEIRTCYHEHCDRPHQRGAGSWSAIQALQAKFGYIKYLLNRRRAAQLRKIKVESVDRRLPPQLLSLLKELAD